ncbi:Ger(x)C family spore germination protein [Bacillaceae bacterium IKA-2]|nr:Ger(x)C family spore germination protein [Bacillaceae bacterium IKA-2]
MKIIKLFLIFIYSLILVGCWNKHEINEIAIVIGVGIDKIEDQYVVTAQVIKPLPKGGGGGEDLSTWSITSRDITVGNAINELSSISPRPLYWPHLQIIIFSEAVAKEGLGQVISWFTRDRDSRAGAYVVVTRGKAEDLLNQTIELGEMPAKSMASFLDTAEIRNISLNKLKLTNLASILSTPGNDGTLDVIALKEIRGEVETYQITGTAILKKDQLIGYLPIEIDDAVQMAKNEYERGVISTACPNEEGSYITFRITDFENELSLTFSKNIPTVKMNIFIEGNIIDQECPIDLLDPRNISEIEDLIKEEIQQMIQKAFNETAELGADVFGIGQEIRRKRPKVWTEIQDEDRIYLKDLKLEIHVDANIRRTGLIIDSTINKIK